MGEEGAWGPEEGICVRHMQGVTESLPRQTSERRLPEGSAIALEYIPETWSEERFLSSGGFVAVVLNYNKRHAICRAVQSAFDQDYPCYEIWLMDDASTDGSYEEMLEFAQGYQGPQKLTVVRHTQNQSITGQWNCVTRLSTGTWFGMFCGDDESLPNRLQVASDIVSAHPTLRGFCTNFEMRKGDRDSGLWAAPGEWRWQGLQADGVQMWTIVYGCSAFWHRDLFCEPLPRCNFDDLFLTWSAFIRWQTREDEVLFADFNKVTVRYSLGTGISTELEHTRGKFLTQSWKHYQVQKQFFAKKVLAWQALCAYDAVHGQPSSLRAALRVCLMKDQMLVVNFWDCVKLLCIFYREARSGVYGPYRRHLCLRLWYRFIRRLFGPLGMLLEDFAVSLRHR